MAQSFRYLFALRSFICLALLLQAMSAVADPPSFTYVEAEYVAAGEFDISDGNLAASVDLDGFALNASVEFGVFILQASRFELESDELLGGKFEDSISSMALGLAFELPRSQVYGLVRGRRDELSLTAAGFDENEDSNSVGVEAGVRFNLTDNLELNASVGSPDLEDGTSFSVGGQFFVTDNIGITLKYTSLEIEADEITAEFDTTSLGVRFSF